MTHWRDPNLSESDRWLVWAAITTVVFFALILGFCF